MSKHIIILLAVSLMSIPVAAQKSQKSKSGSSAPKPVYIEAKKRNYAQNLGGFYYYDYTFMESRGLSTQCPCKGEGKKLTAQYAYPTFDEAYSHIMAFPAPADLDTREKMTYYHDCMLTPVIDAVDLCEPEPEYDAEVKRLQKLRMDNAKLAAKGKPFDTIPFDPKMPQYYKVIDKIHATVTPLDKQYRDVVDLYSTDDLDWREWLADLGGVTRFYYNNYSAMLKQMTREWFGSEECKQVQKIEDELRARVEAEQPKKTPDWFVDGRKREGELVAQYNRRLVERWIKKAPTANMAATKAAIAKLIAYQKEIEAIRGDDAITEAYISAHSSCKGCIQAMFKCYYTNMMMPIPLVRTPDTQEGKKLKLEETPWVLPHPFEQREQ